MGGSTVIVQDDESQEDVRKREREDDAWFRREVQIGMDSARAGHLIPAAEVEARFAAKRAATRRRLGLAE